MITKRNLFFGFFLLFVFSGSAYAAKISHTGSLPRSLSSGAFDVTITISEITAAQLPDTAAGQSAAERLEIKINNDSTELLFNTEDGYQTNKKFYIELLNQGQEGPLPDDNIADNFKFVYQLRIRDTDGSGTNLSAAAQSGQLQLQVKYTVGESEVANTGTQPLVLNQEFYAITDAPEFEATAVVGSNQSLKVQFQSPGEVSTTKGNKTAQNVIVVVVDQSIVTSNEALTAFQFVDSADSEDLQVACTYLPDNVGTANACVDCAEDLVYLDKAALAQETGFVVKEASVSSGAAVISGLSNDKTYTVFMQYEPAGTQRSSCISAKPSANFSLTELNEEGEAKTVDFRCFIATATYGSALHSKVELFRKFRDEVLLKSAHGERLVHLYYEYSPALADAIKANPWLRSKARQLLEAPATVLGWFFND